MRSGPESETLETAASRTRDVEAGMRATVGDRLHVHGRTVGAADRVAEIIEVRGTDGGPPYLVRFPDGRENLIYPGPDSVIETSEGQPK
jgi:hypothetical protein